MLLSRWAKERSRDGHPLQLQILDVRKAYFNATPQRNIYVRLPSELGLRRGVVGKLKTCMYGTRDAGAIWEATYTTVLLKMGFAQGASSPCVFYHSGWKVSLVVHGSEFNAFGTTPGLDKCERGMLAAFDVELRGRLGDEVGTSRG